MKANIMTIAVSVPVLVAAACSRIEMDAGPDVTGKMCVEMSAAGKEDGTFHEVSGWRFEGEILAEIMCPEQGTHDGQYVFSPSDKRGDVYFLANYSGVESLVSMRPEETSRTEFLKVAAGTEEMTSSGILMNGYADLGNAGNGTVAVRMERAVSRIDIASYDAGVEILQVTLSGLYSKGFVLPQPQIAVPEYAQAGDLYIDYSGSPLENAQEVLAYVPEQASVKGALVTVDARLDGGLHRIEVCLPAVLERNVVYTVRIRGNGSDLSAEVVYDDWETGTSSGSDQFLRATVDADRSELGHGVRLSAGRDSVFFPYTGSASDLYLRIPAGAAVIMEGEVKGVAVDVSGEAFHVNAVHRQPGGNDGVMFLNVYEEGSHVGKIVLVFKANPVKVTGKLVIDDNGVCDFGKYIDGELGTVSIPYGKVLSLEFGGENEWMKAELIQDSETGRVYRILGGWRPNDPEADGRVQEVSLVISCEDGSEREEYVVRRVNWGLPVVRIGDTWWTRYNLRGNVKSFEDQITCSEDPVAHDGLLDYLSTVPEDALLELLGDQYQGGNPQGLPLRHDGQVFYHEGMGSSGQNFGTLDPSLMAPDGYEIPAFKDYAYFTNNDNYNLGGIGTRPFNNRYGARLSVTIVEREVEFLGHAYGTLTFYEFTDGGNKWVLCGLGHQWNAEAGNIAVKNLIMATYGDSGRTWSMEGYAENDRPGQNWLKFVANNTVKTRMIRCVKTPVEYIY